MRFLKALVSHLVEVISGLALVGVGIVVTNLGSSAHPESNLDIVIGAIATAFGGVLLSWTVGKEISRGDALKEIRSQLDLVSRNLGQASGQISRAVEQAQSHDLQATTSFALVSQAATMIYGQVSAIQTILGGRFDAEDLLFTVTELESLAVRLEKKTSGSDEEVDAVRSRLQEMRTQLSHSTVTKAKSSETVSCPHCAAPTVVTIGLNGGDTATKVCANCNRRFNTHRRPDGSLFMRFETKGAAANGAENNSNSVAFEGSCPECQSDIRIVPAKLTASGKHGAVCVQCGASLEFDLESRYINIVGQMEKAPGTLIGSNAAAPSGRPVVRCPICSKNLVCIIRREDVYYATDSSCNRIYEVSKEDFDRWRADPSRQNGDPFVPPQDEKVEQIPAIVHFQSSLQ